MELDKGWETFFGECARRLCFWFCRVWVENMDEKVPVFYSNHWDVIEIKRLRSNDGVSGALISSAG